MPPTLTAFLWTVALATDSASPVRWMEPNPTYAAPPAAPVVIGTGPAAPPSAESDALYSAPTIHIDVVDADIRSVLRLVSSVSGLNFVVPDHVQSVVTVQLTDVPWDLAVAAILSAEGLRAVPFSEDVILIEPLIAAR